MWAYTIDNCPDEFSFNYLFYSLVIPPLPLRSSAVPRRPNRVLHQTHQCYVSSIPFPAYALSPFLESPTPCCRMIVAHLCTIPAPPCPPLARDIVFIASSPRFFSNNSHCAHANVASSTSPVPRQYSYTSRTNASPSSSPSAPASAENTSAHTRALGKHRLATCSTRAWRSAALTRPPIDSATRKSSDWCTSRSSASRILSASSESICSHEEDEGGQQRSAPQSQI